MLKTFFSFIFIAITFSAVSQNFEQQFKEFSSKEDTTGQTTVLKQWEAARPKDPELFIAYFNYYAGKSRREIVSLDDEKKDKSFSLTDSTGKPAGYLGSTVEYDGATLQKGFDFIDRGIALYPSRLDMRFGKIYMLGEMGNFPEFTNVIVQTIEYGNSIKHAWMWEQGKPLDDAKEFFLSSVQDYVGTLYNTEDDELLPSMRRISETVLKYFPDHVESLANVALTYLVAGDFDKALPYLLKAEKVAPKDIIVLNNIAETYKRKNDKANAKVYYEKIIKYGNTEEVQEAKEKLKELR
ncbi:MAG: hypothetical protein WDN26_04000 [Chitinophagaceae bacterium]